MTPAIRERLAAALGVAIARVEPVHGGDINEAFALVLADGTKVFVKTHAAAPEGAFAREAEGLDWLRSANALRVPDVLAVDQEFLALEFLEPARPAPDHDEALGRGLAQLHRAGAPSFGFERDNYLAHLPQPNEALPSWPRFYVERRLAPMIALAERRGRVTARMSRGFDAVFARIDAIAESSEPPARLHGDLWLGNCHRDAEGRPALVDPAVYGGHREIDLAMMRLFGGFSDRVYAAYEEEWPLADGWRERVPLHQLYPLVVHVVLFGGSYARSVENALDALL